MLEKNTAIRKELEIIDRQTNAAFYEAKRTGDWGPFIRICSRMNPLRDDLLDELAKITADGKNPTA